MRTETFTWRQVTCTIGTPTRRQAITQAAYKQALRRAYPAIVEYETATFQTPIPQAPLTDGLEEREQQALRARYEERLAVFHAKLLHIGIQYPVGAALAGAMNDVSFLLTRITELDGAVFTLNGKGVFADDQVVRAMEDWLDDARIPDQPDESFWATLMAQLTQFDRPQTNATLKPPEALTDAEKADPLS